MAFFSKVKKSTFHSPLIYSWPVNKQDQSIVASQPKILQNNSIPAPETNVQHGLTEDNFREKLQKTS